MRFIIFSSFVCLLSACATPPQLAMSGCPDVGIDIQHPQFYQPANPAVIDGFYTCQIKAIEPTLGNILIGTIGILGNRDVYDDTIVYQNLQYQQNLWRQIAAYQVTPMAAQSQWIDFNSQQVARQNEARSARNSFTPEELDEMDRDQKAKNAPYEQQLKDNQKATHDSLCGHAADTIPGCH